MCAAAAVDAVSSTYVDTSSSPYYSSVNDPGTEQYEAMNMQDVAARRPQDYERLSTERNRDYLQLDSGQRYWNILRLQRSSTNA